MIINTRPIDLANRINLELEDQGINFMHIPLSTIEPIEELTRERKSIIKDIYKIDAIVFTSMSSVQYGIDMINRYGSLESFNGEFISIGPRTAEALKEKKIQSLIPEQYNSEGLKKLLENFEYSLILIISSSSSEELLKEMVNLRVEYVFSHTARVNLRAITKLLKTVKIGDTILIYSKNIFNAIASRIDPTMLNQLNWVVPSDRIMHHLKNNACNSITTAKSALDSDMLQACIKN